MGPDGTYSIPITSQGTYRAWVRDALRSSEVSVACHGALRLNPGRINLAGGADLFLSTFADVDARPGEAHRPAVEYSKSQAYYPPQSSHTNKQYTTQHKTRKEQTYEQ